MVSLTLLVLVGVLLSGTDGWLFGRSRRRTDVHQHVHNHNTNHCTCDKVIMGLLDRVAKIEKKVGIREVADILDLDENYPGLIQFMEKLGAKRDGMVDRDNLESVIKRASQKVTATNVNYCHCSRSVVDLVNLDMV